MSDGSHREHIHPTMLNATLYVGISKLMAKLECSKSAAVLYALNEGLFRESAISQEDHDLLAKRYARKLKEVIAATQAKKEPSHVPVLSIEQGKDKANLEQKDRQFRGMLEQWDQHPDVEWRQKAFAGAEKFKDRLDSAKLLIAKAESAI